MLTQVHFLLTYTCIYECDHCFLYCGPGAKGTFTLSQIRDVLEEAKKLGSVEYIYFEGGEPFLFYPLMKEGLRQASRLGFKTGIVTNCYWATDEEDARLWLEPLVEHGLGDLSLSDDDFHSPTGSSPAKTVARAAGKLGMASTSICIEQPVVRQPADDKGEPVVRGGALLKGRAAEKLTRGLPRRPPQEFDECTHEELVEPHRVHVDALGNVFPCQGVSIGNMWDRPLSEIISEYDAHKNPICGPLCRGGPAELARAHAVNLDGEFVDECHYCYSIRRALMDRFPNYLTPPQVYGVETE